MSGNRVVTFGGCHSEYVHMSDVCIFDLTSFVEKGDPAITCEKVKFERGLLQPSSRWGHTACVYQDQIYIHGGRNENDIADLHVFDPNLKKWSRLALKERLPKPRRRASAVFIASSLIMFGGFDGEFYNDLHALHLNEKAKRTNYISPSTLDSDYVKTINNPAMTDLTLVITQQGAEKYRVQANRSLLLHRIFEKEL